MKHIIFKLLSVMFVILIVAAAVGCGKKGSEEATSTPVPTAVPTATVPAEPTGETGTLSGLEGDVQVMRAGASAWEAANSGMKVGTGYGVKTGSDGYVLITFFDGSVMELEADTEISVTELSKASGGSTTIRISQVLGNTLNRVENLVDSSSTYEIETPAGSAVVRGTWFNVLLEWLGLTPRTCCGTLDQGDGQKHFVDFTNADVTKQVDVNRMSCATGDGIPSDPFPDSEAHDPLQGSSLGGGGGGSSCIPCIDCGDCEYLGPYCSCYYGCCVCEQTTCAMENEYCVSDGDCCSGLSCHPIHHICLYGSQ